MPINIKLHGIDYAILTLYFVLGIGFALKRTMKGSADFFLSGLGHRARIPLGKSRSTGGHRHGGVRHQIRDHDESLLLGGRNPGVVLIKLTPVRQK